MLRRQASTPFGDGVEADFTCKLTRLSHWNESSGAQIEL